MEDGNQSMYISQLPHQEQTEFTLQSWRNFLIACSKIMATLYRLWSKLMCKLCKHLLRYFGAKFPRMVTRLLPRRGAKTAIYDFQALIEIARSRKPCLTGITLDLRKWFNLINRSKARKLLQLFAIPDWIVDKWFFSILKSGACSEVRNSSTGVPEGDAFSVLVMVIIAATWTIILVRCFGFCW